MLDRLADFFFGKARKTSPKEIPPPQKRPLLTEVPSPLKLEAPPQPELLTRDWSHPFGDRSNPLQQLTHLAKAADGYYPLGVHGSWHGGVHFDGGTAGELDQSRVLCLADGEVVAYRIPTRTPTTRYFLIPNVPTDAPCASGFVLVRHRIQAPAIDGCNETPPTLTFYSLYMHLQDWAAYEDSKLERPKFWMESEAKWVKEGKEAPDFNRAGEHAVRVVHSTVDGKTLDHLTAGTQVAVSGTGAYRQLENSLGPSRLLGVDGALRGYVSMRYLKLHAGELFTVTADALNVRAEPDPQSAVLVKLPARTLVAVSGSGDFVKLERIVQHVPISALRSEQVPAACDQVHVPAKPIPIKAGELIGHIGPYQRARDSQPAYKLHLEVFCTSFYPDFLAASRAWADRLPAKERTWLKVAKGSLAIIRKADHGKYPPAFVEPHHIVDADLLIPKSVLDNLPAANKIHQPKDGGRKARNWYYLEGLLNDKDGNIVDGWVLEIVGETPWYSPWHWEGYEVISNSATQTLGMAYRLSQDKNTSEEDLARLRPSADEWEQGALQSRLYDIIDRNRDRKMCADEIRTALSIPAHAQALSRIVLDCESEWYYRQEKWDALDQVFGHTTSAPILNWMAEKERIKELSWWGDVREELKLPKGPIYFLQPIGLLGMRRDNFLIDVNRFLSSYEEEHRLFASGTTSLSDVSKRNLRVLLEAINDFYSSDQQGANLYVVAYMLATVRHETYHYPTQEFFSEKPEVGDRSYFDKYDPVLAKTELLRNRAVKMGNTTEGDGFKYRGRGCVHLTWKVHYQKFSELLGYDFVSDPDAAGKFKHSIPIMIIGMNKGYFTGKGIKDYFSARRVDYVEARKIINGKDQAELIAAYAMRFESILRKTSNLTEAFNDA